MAVDTREKRASVVGINYLSGPSPTPNAGKDQEWRQEVGYGYSGILAASAAPTQLKDLILRKGIIPFAR
jgi:hypothetical protein